MAEPPAPATRPVGVSAGLVGKVWSWASGVVTAPLKIGLLAGETKRLSERLDAAVERISYLEGSLEQFTTVIDQMERRIDDRVERRILEHMSGSE